MEAKPAPFKDRKLDWLFVLFFAINLLFITYIVDLEQLVLPDPYHYQQPVWPPAPLLQIIHNYGMHIDPLLMARPQWWKDTIWLDVLFYGPFYAAAIYAFVRGRNWIRLPAIFYSGMMFADVFIILGEEIAGPYASPQLPLVLALNLPWLLVPLCLAWRMRGGQPFVQSTAPSPGGVAQVELEHSG